MSGWKGGGLLLILAIPLALYAAWQVKGVVRADMVVSDAPPDRGGTKEQLATMKAKASGFAEDARKASGVALQYRGKDAGDMVTTPAAGEVIKAVDERAAYLTDLDQFLNGAKKPDYRSKMAPNFVEWAKDMKATQETNQAVTDWLLKPVTVNAAGDGDARIRELDQLLSDYRKTGFASRPTAAQGQVRGRLKVIDQLAQNADKAYPDALKVSLPLKSGDNDLKTTLDTLKALKAHAAALSGDIEQANLEKADLTPYQADIDRLKGAAAKSVSREKLLGLFAQDKLFSNPTGASAWLQDVAALHRQSPLEDKRQIRKKVQEFCEAYIPAVARLDDKVLVGGKVKARDAVKIKYRKDGAPATAPLSVDPNGLTEFNVATMFDPQTTFVLAPDEGFLSTLKPTELSGAAVFYNEARRAVPPGVNGIKWTAKTVEDLKNKCEAQKKLVDQLKPLRKFDDAASDDEAKIFARLEGLLEGLKGNSELVEGGQ